MKWFVLIVLVAPGFSMATFDRCQRTTLLQNPSLLAELGSIVRNQLTTQRRLGKDDAVLPPKVLAQMAALSPYGLTEKEVETVVASTLSENELMFWRSILERVERGIDRWRPTQPQISIDVQDDEDEMAEAPFNPTEKKSNGASKTPQRRSVTNRIPRHQTDPGGQVRAYIDVLIDRYEQLIDQFRSLRPHPPNASDYDTAQYEAHLFYYEETLFAAGEDLIAEEALTYGRSAILPNPLSPTPTNDLVEMFRIQADVLSTVISQLSDERRTTWVSMMEKRKKWINRKPLAPVLRLAIYEVRLEIAEHRFRNGMRNHHRMKTNFEVAVKHFKAEIDREGELAVSNRFASFLKRHLPTPDMRYRSEAIAQQKRW